MTLTSKVDAKFVNTDFIFEDRLDAHYYSDKFYSIENKIKSSPFGIKKFVDITKKIKCGPFGSSVLAENYDESGIIMVRPLNLKEVLLSNDDLVRFPEKALGDKFLIFKHQDLLFARVGMPSCSVIPETYENVTISPNIIAAELKENVDAYYIAIFMNTPFGLLQIERRFKAVSQPTISTEELKTLDIPLPDFKYQKYVGNKVRKAEQLREETKRLKKEIIRKVNELFIEVPKNNIYSNFLTVKNHVLTTDRLDPGYYSYEHVNAKSAIDKYQTIKLNEIAYVTDGDHGTPTFVETGIPFLRSKNISEYLIDLSDLVFIDKEYEEKYLKSSRLQKEDILLTKIGTIGKSAMFLGMEANLNANAALIRVKDNKNISPYFLCALLNSDIFNVILNKEAGGAVQAALSLQRLGEIKIPLISMDIQKEIEKMLITYLQLDHESKEKIQEAKDNIESLIEGTFDESVIKEAE